MKKAIAAMLMACCLTIQAQTASNGQQIVVGGVRFDDLKIIGQNQNRQPATWRKQFRSQGVTMAVAESWWWLGSARVEARFGGATMLVCQTRALNVGFMFVFVLKENNGCTADNSNSSPMAQKLEVWLKSRTLRQVKTIQSNTVANPAPTPKHEISGYFLLDFTRGCRGCVLVRDRTGKFTTHRNSLLGGFDTSHQLFTLKGVWCQKVS